MSDEPPRDVHGPGVVGAASRVTSQVVQALSPQFLSLLLVNVIFMGVFVWFVNARAEHTIEIVRQLMDACLKGKL